MQVLNVSARVAPRRGDVLIFPHGSQHPGGASYPDPLHEGSMIERGEKLLIRTDLIFDAPPARAKPSRRAKQTTPRLKAEPAVPLPVTEPQPQSQLQPMHEIEMHSEPEPEPEPNGADNVGAGAKAGTCLGQVEALLQLALLQVCPAQASLAQGTVKDISERGGADLESTGESISAS